MNERNDDPLDQALSADLLAVPGGFEQRVMARIDLQALPVGLLPGQDDPPGRRWLEWLGLTAAGLAGLLQVLAFIFGVWSTSALS